MANWPEIVGVENGQFVDADTFNPPLSRLAARTDYLKFIVDSIEDRGALSSVQVTADASGLSIGDVVCVDPETKRYVKAVASMSLYDAYTASERAYAVGIVADKRGDEGVIVLYGSMSLKNVDADGMTDEGVMVNGQYYLSSVHPGRITRFPTGPRVLVGFFSKNYAANGEYDGAMAVVNPQHMDIESHSHRTYVLRARPAGDVETADGVVRIVGRYPDGFAPPESSTDVPGFTGVPRLVVGGDYTSHGESSYTVTVTDHEGRPTSSWPCYVNWTATGADAESGSGMEAVGYFGQEVPIGSLGMTVRLQPSYGMDESAPVQTDDPPDLVWTVSRESSRGWSDCSVNASAELGSCTVVFGGYPDRSDIRLNAVVPSRIFDMTALSVGNGDRVSIDGEEFVFTDADGTNADESDDAVRVLIGGDPYETMVALSEECGKVIWDDSSRMAVSFADSVVVTRHGESSGTELAPVLENGSPSVWFMVVFLDGGESVAVPHSGYPVTVTSTQYPEPLANGMTYKVVGGQVSVGDSARAETFFQSPGAVYRYNIEFDNDFKKHFPPVPAKSGSLMLNGVELEPYGLYGNPSVYSVGEDSLYWRDASPGRQPWPASVPDVDTEDEYRLLFHFVSEFHSETGPVTSLRPAEGSPIVVRRCGTTDDSAVGDLELDVDFTYDVSDMGVPGYKAVKASRNGKLLLGPVVERIVAGPGISLTRKSGQPDGQGSVTISADGAKYDGDFETVALENAKLESIGMFPYVRFLGWDAGNEDSNIPTGFVAKFHVPATAEYGVYRVRFYATVFGEESYSGEDSPLFAGVRMDYNILPDYNSVNGGVVETANLKSGLISPDSPSVLDIPFGTMGSDGAYSYSAYDPLLAHNDTSLEQVAGRSVLVFDHAFPTANDCGNYLGRHQDVDWTLFGVKPGYTVAIRFSRTSPSSGPAYTAPIGFLNLRWAVERVASVDTGASGDTPADIVTQTVLELRKVAGLPNRMANSYDLVGILTRIIRALQ